MSSHTASTRSLSPASGGQTRSRRAPTSGWVFNVRELGRRPGTMRHEQRTLPAPQGLGGEVAGVRAGSPLALDLRLEAVSEGVLVSGSVHAGVEGVCARCLDPVHTTLDVVITELFDYPDTRARRADDDELDPSLVVRDEHLDVGPLVHDEIVLALPVRLLCRPDCPGLCPECGTPLAEAPGHRHETMDPRWAALRALTEQKES